MVAAILGRSVVPLEVSLMPARWPRMWVAVQRVRPLVDLEGREQGPARWLPDGQPEAEGRDGHHHEVKGIGQLHH